MTKTGYNLEGEEKVPVLTSCRWIVAYITFLGTIVLYLMRINMSVAIVCMTYDITENDTWINSSTNQLVAYVNDNCPDLDDPEDDTSAEFDWNRQLRGWVLSSFFYGYTVTQFPAGWLARRYGAKIIIFLGIAFTMLGTMVSPVAARASPYMLITVRVLMGTASGLFYPAMAHLLSSWAPPAERSRIAGVAYSGSSMGSILTFALSGILCEYGFAGGWPSVFYVYGLVSVLWLLAFLVFIYDSPAQHPRISTIERDYITKSLGERPETENVPVPWRQFWSSGRLWALVVADVTYGWGLYTLLTSLPQYFKDVLKFDLATSGIYNSMPYLCQCLWAIASSFIVDWFILKGVSVTIARKVAETVALLPGAAFLIGTAFLDCNQPMVAVAFLSTAVGLSGAHRCGVAANQIDIAPRFAGLIMGVSNCIGNITGIVAPTVNAALVPTGALSEWQRVFYMTAAIQTLGALVFLCFASGEVQDWAKLPDDEMSVTVNGLDAFNVDINKQKAHDNEAYIQTDTCTENKEQRL